MLESAAIIGMPMLAFFGELVADMTLVLKIFVLMAIIAYITNHLGKGPLAIMIIAVFSWFIIFDYFMLFGGIYILYILLIGGLTGVIIDIFFVTPMPGAGGGAGASGEPISHGYDFTHKRAAAYQMMGRR